MSNVFRFRSRRQLPKARQGTPAKAGDEVFVCESFDHTFDPHGEGEFCGWVVIHSSSNGSSAASFGPFPTEARARQEAVRVAAHFGAKLLEDFA